MSDRIEGEGHEAAQLSAGNAEQGRKPWPGAPRLTALDVGGHTLSASAPLGGSEGFCTAS